MDNGCVTMSSIKKLQQNIKNNILYIYYARNKNIFGKRKLKMVKINSLNIKKIIIKKIKKLLLDKNVKNYIL